MQRIGYGEDIHRLVVGRRLVLAGIDIPFDKGLLGHSDADVVCHALCDALLGALALGDIGLHFPDSDRRYENIDSTILLKQVAKLVEQNGYVVGNVDIAISLEKPRLAPYILKMRQNLSSILMIDISAVSIKAMSNEGLDAVGQGQACRAVAVVLLSRK
ncbi:MAG: 2-C-methyl-D-erythritol 2,4-cyclodiphosphate synthase [Bacteroidia bacterium]|nr:2-C-methyl-D-erythritol 2,4-cyclodiphosphate synthase [Bacteroidia bacterium]